MWCYRRVAVKATPKRGCALARIYSPGSGTARLRQIFRARRSGISACLGTASTARTEGLIQIGWERPSRVRWKPYLPGCCNSALCLTSRPPSHARHPAALAGAPPLDDPPRSRRWYPPGSGGTPLWFLPASSALGFPGASAFAVVPLSFVGENSDRRTPSATVRRPSVSEEAPILLEGRRSICGIVRTDGRWGAGSLSAIQTPHHKEGPSDGFEEFCRRVTQNQHDRWLVPFRDPMLL